MLVFSHVQDNVMNKDSESNQVGEDQSIALSILHGRQGANTSKLTGRAQGRMRGARIGPQGSQKDQLTHLFKSIDPRCHFWVY